MIQITDQVGTQLQHVNKWETASVKNCFYSSECMCKTKQRPIAVMQKHITGIPVDPSGT